MKKYNFSYDCYHHFWRSPFPYPTTAPAYAPKSARNKRAKKLSLHCTSVYTKSPKAPSNSEN